MNQKTDCRGKRSFSDNTPFKFRTLVNDSTECLNSFIFVLEVGYKIEKLTYKLSKKSLKSVKKKKVMKV